MNFATKNQFSFSLCILTNDSKNSIQYEEFGSYVLVKCQTHSAFQKLVDFEQLNRLVEKYADKTLIYIYDEKELGLTIEVASYKEF